MSTVCSTKNTTVGTSTSCSATCDPRRAVRCGILSWRRILGTSITCSATKSSDMSVIFRTSTTGSPHAAQEHRGSAPGARNPRSVPLRAAPVPEAPAALPGCQAASFFGVFFDVELEEPLGRRGFCRCGPGGSRLVLGTLFAACILQDEWCVAVATAMRMDCCSCRHHERILRCLRRRAAPELWNRPVSSSITSTAQKKGSPTCLSLVVGCLLFWTRTFSRSLCQQLLRIYFNFCHLLASFTPGDSGPRRHTVKTACHRGLSHKK